eukprot:GHVQ01023542.1.p2 GENE.GHVQ01023542.1~~GHVQ01023542.1.p2  ORF type:complete len:101 (-),score=8.45 GHVQ01023542.1:1987-2289(-)
MGYRRAEAQVSSKGTNSLVVVKYILLDGSFCQLVDGSFIGGLAMSETCSGSDVISMKTKATPQDTGEYVLNGTKMWITNGPSADIVVVREPCRWRDLVAL